MKRILLFTAGLMIAASTQVSAQASKFSLGPTVGFGHSWTTNMVNGEFHPSGQVGASLIYSQSEHWGWGGDLAVSSEGYTMGRTMNNVYTTMSVAPLYLRLTPKAYYFFGNYGQSIRPKVYLGPSVAYKLDEMHYVNGTRMDNTSDAIAVGTNRSGDVINDWDLGVTAGAGANFRIMPRTWLNTDLGFYQGVLDVTDNNMLNQNLRVNVGLMFGL